MANIYPINEQQVTEIVELYCEISKFDESINKNFTFFYLV